MPSPGRGRRPEPRCPERARPLLIERTFDTVPGLYAELHCHTNFSFLDGASHPEELVDEAARLGLAALAVTDHDGCYGVVRFAEAARAAGLPTVFGAELTLRPRSRRESRSAETGRAGPGGGAPGGAGRRAGGVRPARPCGERGADGGREGRAALHGRGAGRRVTRGRAPRRQPGEPGERRDWFVLTGCRKGAVPRALVADGPAAARRELDRLVHAFGRERVLVELWDHGDPLDRHRNDELALVAAQARVEVVATNNVHYATPRQRPSRPRSRRSGPGDRSMSSTGGCRPPGSRTCGRRGSSTGGSPRWPGAVERTVEIAEACTFDLRLAAPNLPDLEVPDGHTDMSWLRELTRRSAAVRYPSTHPQHDEAMVQIAHELDVIEQLDFPGYFLLLVDIVDFCRRSDIYCQGRGSAANSAVCYALGVTKADAVALGLLFERFLSLERDGPPDIDLDIEHERREEVIQYVYGKYGRDRAAQVANVITYRPRSAMREMAKVAGLSPGQADALTKWVDRHHRDQAAFEGFGPSEQVGPSEPGGGEAEGKVRVPELVLDLAQQVLDYPRHLGIHSGGMVMADRPLVEFCPVEWARMEHRSVLQWDKDDCAAAGLVKFDLLGLGMLTMLHLAVDLIRAHEGVEVDLATIPQEEEVYDLLCAADTVGVFQVESRAQMATLPRLRPSHLLRPGDRGRADPSRPDPGRLGAPVPASAHRRGGGHLPAPEPRGVPREDARGPAVPGAAHADRDRRGRVHSRRGRPAAPGDGLEALEGAHGRDARAAPVGDGRAGDHRRDGRGDRHQARGVRALRVSREPLGELRLPRVLELLGEVPPPGRVRVRAAERAADGVLLTAHDRARRGAPRCGGARAVRPCVAARLHAGATHRGSRADRSPATRLARGDVHPRDAHRACGTCAGCPTRCSIGSTRPGTRTALPRPLGLRPPDRRAGRRAGGPRDRRRVHVLRHRASRGAVGRRCAERRAGHEDWCSEDWCSEDRCSGDRCSGGGIGGLGHGDGATAGDGDGGGRAGAPGDGPGRGDRCGPVGHGDVGEPTSHRVRARMAAQPAVPSPQRICARSRTGRSSR